VVERGSRGQPKFCQRFRRRALGGLQAFLIAPEHRRTAKEAQPQPPATPRGRLGQIKLKPNGISRSEEEEWPLQQPKRGQMRVIETWLHPSVGAGHAYQDKVNWNLGSRVWLGSPS
jgi:hypothetical protein